jgi:hypothetical protein
MRAIAITLVLIAATTASATLYDDFEYADQAAMDAVWSGANGVLDDTAGNPGKSMYHPGGAQDTRMLDAVLTEAPGQPIVWEFDLYQGTTGVLGNDRVTCTFDKVTWGWIEFGLYNDLVDPNDPGGLHVDGYGMRLVGNSGENWVSFPDNPTLRTGWHHFKATLSADEIVFEGWLAEGLNAGGNPQAAEYVTYTSTAHDGTGLQWDEVKIGGPSGLSSGDGANFDNISVMQIPEPASILLIGLLALVRRR